MTDYHYHHLGIPNTAEREHEDYLDSAKMFHTHFDDNPFGIEWLRFKTSSPLPELVKTCPHIAFKVDNLEAAIAGKKIIIAPTSPSGGVRVAFIEFNGAPIEFLEYDEATQVNDFPLLETDRLHLRQITSADAPALFKLRTNPTLMAHMDVPMMTSERQALESINTLNRKFIEHTIPFWGISLVEDSQQNMIGYIGYTKYLKAHKRAEIGYALDPAHWRKGIISESMQAILQYGFHEMELHSVEANVSPENSASIKVLEKFNFKKEALFKENWYFNGKFIDSAIYSLLKQNVTVQAIGNR